MKKILQSLLQKIFPQEPGNDMLINKLADIEKKVDLIKIRVDDMYAVKIDSIVVDKIICDRVETNYKIDSVTNENLSGTMNIGTVFNGPHSEYLRRMEEVLSGQSISRKPKISINYGDREEKSI